MIIRPFRAQDFHSILDIYAQSKLDELRFEHKTFELLPLDQDSKRLTELKAADIYVCVTNEVVGYGALFENEIRALFIHPDYREQGFGKRLLEFLLDQTNGSVCLYVAKSNQPAKALYAQYGFEIIDEFETTYNGISVQAHKMLMKRSLADVSPIPSNS